jgi:hypothetical protein
MARPSAAVIRPSWYARSSEPAAPSAVDPHGRPVLEIRGDEERDFGPALEVVVELGRFVDLAAEDDHPAHLLFRDEVG